MARQKFLKPKPKYDKKSWQKRNEAREVLQKQHAKTQAPVEIEPLDAVAP